MCKYFTLEFRHFHSIDSILRGHRQNFSFRRVTCIIAVGKLMDLSMLGFLRRLLGIAGFLSTFYSEVIRFSAGRTNLTIRGTFHSITLMLMATKLAFLDELMFRRFLLFLARFWFFRLCFHDPINLTLLLARCHFFELCRRSFHGSADIHTF